MNNPVLQSESFERAAYALKQAIESGVKCDSFEESVRAFKRSVDKLVTAMGMQAENQHRERCGNAISYGEEAFQSL